MGTTHLPHPITAVYGGDADFTGSSAPAFTQVVQPTGSEPATVTLSLAPGTPSTLVFGQPVTVTVTVTGDGIHPPTGTVTVIDTVNDPAAIELGEEAVQEGVAIITGVIQLAGSSTLSAVYNGNGYYGSSSSSTSSSIPPTITVTPGNTTTQVSSSFNPSGYGAQVTFTAVVAPQTASGIAPTGSVTFTIDGATPGITVPLIPGSGTASASYTPPAPGLSLNQTGQSHVITAAYTGDPNGNYNPSDSTLNPLDQVVQAVGTDPVTVSVALDTSSSSDPSAFGQSATFIATVASPNPSTLETTPTGTVVFQAGGVASSPVNLVNGSASYATTLLPTGTDSITASYSGDSYYQSTQPNDATAVHQTVNQDGTTVSLSSSTTSLVTGDSETITATVTPADPGAVAPTGLVTFYDGSGNPPIGTASLVSGMATLVLPAPGLPAGANSITATYAGDGNFLLSPTSPVLTVTVSGLNTSLNVSLSSGIPSTTVTNTFTAKVSSPAGSPTGTVTFSDDAGDTFSPNPVTLTSVPPNGSTAITSSSAPMTAGNRTVTAIYTPDNPTFDGTQGSTSVTVLQDTSTSIAATSPAESSPMYVYFGENVTFTATVNDAPNPGNTPTGTVMFYDTTSVVTGQYGPYPLDANGTAMFSPSFLTSTFTPITSDIYAIYTPSGTTPAFTGSTSPTIQAIEVPSESTSTSLATSSFSLNSGQSVTFTATVLDSSGTYSPGGTVTFYDTNLTTGSPQTTLGTVTLDTNATTSIATASITTTSLGVGTHSILAVFSSSGFVGSQSQPIQVTVANPS